MKPSLRDRVLNIGLTAAVNALLLASALAGLLAQPARSWRGASWFAQVLVVCCLFSALEVSLVFATPRLFHWWVAT